jgi:Ser/Thr protein kinase RdoA (MazF antagonist)
MLRLSQIRTLKESVDDDWRSPVADAVAEAWGIPAGTARWWRSSATHVFVVPGRSRRYLRFAPAGSPAAVRLRRGAELAEVMPATPTLVLARPERTRDGAIVVTVETPVGAMDAALFSAAPGAEVDVDELDAPLARRWGAALATFHVTAPPVLASSDPLTAGAVDGPELADAIERLAAGRIETDGIANTVTLHGDFELDNIRFTDEGVAAFDADETRAGVPAEDIALAARSLRGDEGEPSRPELYAAFLDGYRSVHALSPDEEAAVGWHELWHSARRATSSSVLDEGGDLGDPAWQRDLYDALRSAQTWHRRAVLDGVSRFMPPE